MPQIKIVVGILMEKTHVRARLHAIREYGQKVGTEIQGVSRDFVVNMDEIGCTDFVDARKEQAVVPAEDSSPTLLIPTDRSVKRATLVGGIAANGRGLKPLIIVPPKMLAAGVRWSLISKTPDDEMAI